MTIPFTVETTHELRIAVNSPLYIAYCPCGWTATLHRSGDITPYYHRHINSDETDMEA